ncbi:MAG: secretin N-terminal domain-containing protein [Desulfobacterales bacterium]
MALIAAGSADAAVQVIAVKYRSAAELVPIVRTLLSADGKVSADERTNSLIIVDSEEAIARVMHSLAAIDTLPRQVTVRVRFQESAERDERSASAGVRVSGESGSVSAGRPPRDRDGVEVRVQDRTQRSSGSSEQFISTLSGSWAFISVGREVPYTARWAEICRRHGQTVVFHRMETGFEVKVVLQGALAEVEIVPRISGTSAGGRPGEVRFTEASTRVQVPTGRWISIGGSEQGANEVVRAILEAGASRHSSQIGIEVIIEER